MSEPDYHVVSVVIHGQEYAVRSRLDRGYVLELATYLDRKLQEADAATPGGDRTRIAVLAALNIADELFRSREEGRGDKILERTEEIERLLDRALKAAG